MKKNVESDWINCSVSVEAVLLVLEVTLNWCYWPATRCDGFNITLKAAGGRKKPFSPHSKPAAQRDWDSKHFLILVLVV